MTGTEYESTVTGEVAVQRRKVGKRLTMEDVAFALVGDATPGNMLVMIFAMALFGATPVAMLLLFGTYSGGFRWLITLALIIVMGAVAIYLMRRGVERTGDGKAAKEPQTEFRGELTNLTETVERAASGYVYSQQMLRERLCDMLVEKLATIRDMDPEEIVRLLDKGEYGFVGDEFLAKFLAVNRRGSGSWDEAQAMAKGKSAERGRKFMAEIEVILERMEAIV